MKKALKKDSVVEWLRRHERDLSSTPIILGEVRILLLPRGKRRSRLERWFDAGVRELHSVPREAESLGRVARVPSGLRAGYPIKDSLIAVIALVHILTAVTRNRADFEGPA